MPENITRLLLIQEQQYHLLDIQHINSQMIVYNSYSTSHHYTKHLRWITTDSIRNDSTSRQNNWIQVHT